MSIFEILKILIPIIIIASLGALFGRFRKIEIKALAEYLLYIGVPALVFSQLSMQQVRPAYLLLISLAAFFVILGSGLLSWFLLRVLRFRIPDPLFLPIMFMNSGYLGFPLALFAFGELSLNYAIIYNTAMSILLFTLGIYILCRGTDPYRALKIPFIYAALAGLILSYSGIRLPQPLYVPIYILGNTTIPLALFMLGYRLANMGLTSWKMPLLASLLRLGLGLGLGWLAVMIFQLHGIAAKTIILLSCLASAVTSLPLAEEYDSEPELIASSIMLSTLVSFLALFAILPWLASLTI
ncbi:MAG: AEC family transporter [Candidatus Saganbacteria bacterium]|nr:AEC family transporter [Candidatus Saganbacteria bacterium]